MQPIASVGTDPSRAPKNMVWVPGGTFWMGSEDFYPEERPVHEVGVDGFWMDTHQVTVAEFRRFVKATGHVTTAETAPDPADYPDADPALLVPGHSSSPRPRNRCRSTTTSSGGRGCRGGLAPPRGSGQQRRGP